MLTVVSTPSVPPPAWRAVGVEEEVVEEEEKEKEEEEDS